MPRKIFLSIDVDYFEGDEEVNLEDVADIVLTRVHNVSFVTNHQQMLNFVNRTDCTALINIDAHSDLVEIYKNQYEMPLLSCGSWASFVKQKRGMDFWWIYPPRANSCSWSGEIAGDCSSGIFPRNRSKFSRGRVGYRSCRATQGFSLSWLKRICKEVVHVSFCRSPGYAMPYVQQEFLSIARKRGFKVMRGDLDEDNMCTRRLPESDRAWLKKCA